SGCANANPNTNPNLNPEHSEEGQDEKDPENTNIGYLEETHTGLGSTESTNSTKSTKSTNSTKSEESATPFNGPELCGRKSIAEAATAKVIGEAQRGESETQYLDHGLNPMSAIAPIPTVFTTGKGQPVKISREALKKVEHLFVDDGMS
ncbi:unnamed protein product, partial [Discosporangium mesarthrocarpum]